MQNKDELLRAYAMLLNNFMLPGYELFYNVEGIPMVRLQNIGPATPMDEALKLVRDASMQARMRYERIEEELRNPPTFNFSID